LLLSTATLATSFRPSAPHFKEFVVDLNATGRTTREVLAELKNRGILGGIDLSGSFPELGQALLVCVTEVHTKGDIDRLAASLAEIVGGGER